MNPQRLIVGFLPLIALSCGGNATPTGDSTNRQSVSQANTPSPAPAVRNTNTPSPQPNIPAGARWTILCDTRSGPQHVQQVRSLRDDLIRTTGLRDFHIVQGEKQSTLYYGYYRTVRGDDPKEAAERNRAHQDLRRLSEIADPSTGQRVFRNPFLIALEDADPTAPPDWNIANANGYWSLQIMAFRDHAQRKDAAVEAVRDLRSQGFEAYYFHGPAISSVCVGAWPREAVKEQGSSVARPNNPNEVVMVAPGYMKLPDGRLVTPDGRDIVAYQPKMDIQDQKMLATLNRFPYHADNYVEGKRVKVNGVWKDVKQPSFFVVIPNESNQTMARRPATPEPLPDPWRPAKTQQPQGGKLRGIDD